MDTLTSLRVFCQIVASGSFTRAADTLGISTAMASKHLRNLEQRLGVRLMQRNSRSLHLTAEGEAYYQRVSEALTLLDTAASEAGSNHPQGHLRLTAPIWCANPVFARWMGEYLVGEGIDLALRVSKTPAPTLVVRPLFTVQFVLVASPAYLRRHGVPQTPQDAAAHQAVLPSYADISEMPYSTDDGSDTLQLASPLQSNSTLMLHQLLLAGGGIGYLPLWLIEDDLAAGRLVRLLPAYRFSSVTLHAAYPERRHLSAKVRSMIDFLVEKAAAM